MYKKVALWASGVGATVAGFALTVAAHAQTIAAGDISVPTSTVHDLLASVSNIYTDPGLLGLFVVAVGIPLAFVILHYAKGLLPGTRARR